MKSITLIGLGLLLAAAAACAPQQEPDRAAGNPLSAQGRSSEVAPAQTWELAWQSVVAGARKEGKVVVYGSSGPTPREVLGPRLLERFGVEMEFLTAKGSQLAEKIATERRVGLYIPDIYIGGPTTVLDLLKPRGFLDPIEPLLLLPEVKDPSMWVGKKINFLDGDRTLLAFVATIEAPLGLNTNLVKAGEIKSYRDLLSARWKGKLLMNDPTISGTGAEWYAIVRTRTMGIDFMRQLAKQDPVILRDLRLQAEWLAQGKYSVLIGPHDATLSEFKVAGAPVTEFVPEEGAWLKTGGGNISLMNKSPHPNATRLFVNWLLTKEGGLLWQKAMHQQSGRLDVPAEFLDPAKVRQAGVEYISADDDEEFQLKRPEYMKEAREIFGHLMK
ncbi:MAG: extracellular solute-binding protein [Chloroflexi bacterium]|nr:extracellular solute-binding protein [Chloroflexota bacterium]